MIYRYWDITKALFPYVALVVISNIAINIVFRWNESTDIILAVVLGQLFLWTVISACLPLLMFTRWKNPIAKALPLFFLRGTRAGYFVKLHDKYFLKMVAIGEYEKMNEWLDTRPHRLKSKKKAVWIDNMRGTHDTFDHYINFVHRRDAAEFKLRFSNALI